MEVVVDTDEHSSPEEDFCEEFPRKKDESRNNLSEQDPNKVTHCEDLNIVMYVSLNWCIKDYHIQVCVLLFFTCEVIGTKQGLYNSKLL